MADKSLVVTLLGSVEIQVEGIALPRLRTRKGYWLFALLTLNYGRAVPRDWLAGLLWPDSRESQARANLNLSVTDLRKALGKEAYRIESVTTSILRLDLTGASCDLITFDQLAISKERTDLEQAVACYSGLLVPDCYEPWITSEREQREQYYLKALETLAAEATLRQDSLSAVHYLRRIVRRDPYRDSAQAQLMETLVQCGDPNAALQVYQDFLRFLRHDDPLARTNPDLEWLYQQIRSTARRQNAPRPILTSNTSSLGLAPSALARITPLIGREEDVRQVEAALRRSRLVTLTGAGGVGKTSLAMVVAEEVAAEYPNGATIVMLDTLTDPAEIPSRILTALGEVPTSRQKPIETLSQHLSKKTILLILDNLEHLLPNGTAAVQEILRRCSKTTILATSRRALGLPDERAWRVRSLSLPNPTRLPSDDQALALEARLSEAVQLFMERASAKRSDFALTPRNARAIVEICIRLDGIPFAIELAAARVVALPVAELAKRIDNCYRLLTDGNPTALPRHQTLSALMDWSFHLLSSAEQTLLLRLSVFVGGFTLESAEAICPSTNLLQCQILDLLTSLVNHSLVNYEENEGTGRYRLLETVRQYAAERLQASGESSDCLARHTAYFVAFVEAQEPHLTTADQIAALDRLDLEHDNIQAAIRRSASDPATMESAGRLVASLSAFWLIRGHFLIGQGWFDALVPHAPSLTEKSRGKLLLGAALMAITEGDFVKHLGYCNAALEIYRGLHDRPGIARSSLMKSHNWGLPATEIMNMLNESWKLFRLENDPVGIALTLSNLGSKELGEPDIARRIGWLEEGIRLHRQRGDYRNVAVTTVELGYTILNSGGDREVVRLLFEEMLAWTAPLKDSTIRCRTLWLLGGAAQVAMDYKEGTRLLRASITLSHGLGEKNKLLLLGLSRRLSAY